MKLVACDISVQQQQTPILQQVSLQLEAGTLLGILGPNGAGKTTLLRTLAGLQAFSGEILLDQQPLNTIPPARRARDCAYLAQQATAHWPISVTQTVALGRLPYRRSWAGLSAQDHDKIQQAMQKAQVEHLAARSVSSLSGGEQLRVMLARLFAGEPAIIFADEPIASLDPYHQLHTMELLQQHCEQGGSAIVVMHDLNMAARFCQQLALLDQGKLICQQDSEQLLRSPLIEQVYAIERDVIQHPTGLVTIPLQRR